VLVSFVDQEVAAGRGVDIADYPETRSIPVPRELVSGLRAETLRAVTVRGDSMVERAIFDRDIVIFDPLDAGGQRFRRFRLGSAPRQARRRRPA
jgi:SOS-response transcriptional repressor LexA